MVDLDQVQKIENAAKVALPVVVLHDAFVQFEALLLLLVLVDEHGPPEVLIRVLEKTHLLLPFPRLHHPLLPHPLHLLYHLALHQSLLVLGLLLGFVAVAQQTLDDVRHECAQNDGGEANQSQSCAFYH